MRAKTKLDKPLLFVMFVFLVIGLIMVLSASSMASYMRYNKSIYYYFIRHGIFIVIGLAAFCMALFLPSKFYKKISPLLIVILLLALFGLNIYGSVFNASKGWYDLGIMTIQPSELGKICIILYMAYYYEKHKDNLDNQWTLLKPILINIIIFVLVAMQPDLGTASIIFGIVIAIFYTLPLKKETYAPINKIFVGRYFRYFKIRSKDTWEVVKRHKWLSNFAIIYLPIRYLFRLLLGRKKMFDYKKVISTSKQTNEVYENLEVFEKE